VVGIISRSGASALLARQRRGRNSQDRSGASHYPEPCLRGSDRLRHQPIAFVLGEVAMQSLSTQLMRPCSK